MSQPSVPVLIFGFLGFNCLFLFLIGVVAFFLSGLYYVRSIGLFILLPYVTYTYLNRVELNSGARWKLFSWYFPVLVLGRKFLQLEISDLPAELKTVEAKENAQFVFSFHPHGVNCDYRILIDGLLPKHFPNIADKCYTLAASVLFRLPMVREFSLWTGCVDARRQVAEKMLDSGNSIIVISGGQMEQIQTSRGKEIIYLARRKGFIRLALRKGVPVVPVYVFGSSDAYYTSQALSNYRKLFMKTTGISIPLAGGMFGSPFCPLPVKHTIVFGKPMSFEIQMKGHPTSEEIDTAHSEYTKALHELFDEHKVRLGYGDRVLHELK